jgi:hypothetical protein
MADYTPIYDGGVNPFTATTSAAVTGGRLVAVSGAGTVAHAAADSLAVVGVAAHDAASGARVTVWPMDNCIHELLSTGAITASATAGVVADAAGTVKAATIGTAAAAGSLVGVAMTTVGGAALVRVMGKN